MQAKVEVKKRITFILLAMAAILLALNMRLAWIQFVRGDEYQQQALRNRMREVPLEAKRGAILDRNGRELAVSVSAPSVGVFPAEVKKSRQEHEIAAQLAAILGLPEDQVLRNITRNESFWWVKRKVTFEQGAQIKSLRLPGVQVVEETQRFYPNQTLAAHVLGIAGIDNQGLEGLELYYDKLLRGTPGNLVIEKDARGRDIPHARQGYIPPEDGLSLVLTIDETIQYIAERELDLLMQGPSSPKGATVIVMDPKTGDILALANRPTFDPNNFRNFPVANRRNIAVSDNYEPGSTFKIITAAAALEEGVVGLNERFYDPGYIKVGKETIKCWRTGRPHGSQSFVEAVQNSCNPVFVTVGLRMEDRRKGSFYDYIEGFGFGKVTGIDINGEAKGLLRPRDKLKQINLATISIGQGVAVTPIQLITAISAVANGGQLFQPRLVREVRDHNGQVVQRIDPAPVRQVVSKDTARQVSEILEMVVSRGTGTRAYIPGYRVGGKTGTAQKVEGGKYVAGKYVASFAGYAPVNDPRLAILVVVDEPQGIYYGGTVAAPIFKRILEDSLRYLGVPAQYNSEVKPDRDNNRVKEVLVPDVSQQAVVKAQAVIKASGLSPVVQGIGTVVADQIPKPGVRVQMGTQILLYAKEGQPSGEVVVPDLTGWRTREVATIMEALGLKMSSDGTGEAWEQDPVPGTVVKVGTTVRVLFGDGAMAEAISP